MDAARRTVTGQHSFCNTETLRVVSTVPQKGAKNRPQGGTRRRLRETPKIAGNIFHALVLIVIDDYARA